MYCLVEMEHWSNDYKIVKYVIQCSKDKNELEELKKLLEKKFKDFDKCFEIIEL